MLFSSPVFLFAFLPTTIAVYFLLHKDFRNYFLLFFSLFFYAWGEVYYVLLIIFSIFINYLFGVAIDFIGSCNLKKSVLTFAILFNLSILIFSKYINFILDNLNVILTPLGIGKIVVDEVPLPIGISFFTFQAMSYIIDVYRREAKVQKNLFELALYISLFPQLIAGPIVRFHDVAEQIRNRVETLSLFFSGIQRFIYGLAKKILIANPLGEVADQIFSLPTEQLSTAVAWLGIISYSLQIYFDFSGYSDMAIGLGRIFGFRFLENFNYPYISKSIQEFWQRWHISLSNWFKDYLYIPLGGNRRGNIRTYVNLMTVFVLCGLWHGASWNFLIWGGYHGLFLMIERAGLGKMMERQFKVIRHSYTILVVMVGWVFFRAETLGQSTGFLKNMFIPSFGDKAIVAEMYLNEHVLTCLLLAVVLSMPMWSSWNKNMLHIIYNGVGSVRNGLAIFYSLSTASYLVLLMLLCFASVAANTYNPFIYFRF